MLKPVLCLHNSKKICRNWRNKIGVTELINWKFSSFFTEEIKHQVNQNMTQSPKPLFLFSRNGKLMRKYTSSIAL